MVRIVIGEILDVQPILPLGPAFTQFSFIAGFVKGICGQQIGAEITAIDTIKQVMAFKSRAGIFLPQSG